MLDPNRTIGSMFGAQGGINSILGGLQSQQPAQNTGQRFDISGLMQGGPLGFLSKLFGGFGRGNWWSGQQGETPAQPNTQTPATPAATQYSADTSNPNPMNILGGNRNSMMTIGSMLARQPNL